MVQLSYYDGSNFQEVEINMGVLKYWDGNEWVGDSIPDSVVLDDFDDGELTSNRDNFYDLDPAISTNEEGLYQVESRPEWNVVSGNPSNDSGRLFLQNADSNGLQHIEYEIPETSIDTTNIEWEFEIERTSGSNNSAEIGLMLDSYSNGGIWLNYQLNNDDTAVLTYDDGSTNGNITGGITMASGSISDTNHWRIVKEDNSWEVFLDGSSVATGTFTPSFDMNYVWLTNGEVMNGGSQNFDSDIWIDEYFINPY